MWTQVAHVSSHVTRPHGFLGVVSCLFWSEWRRIPKVCSQSPSWKWASAILLLPRQHLPCGIHPILPSSRTPVCLPYAHLCHGGLHQTISTVPHVSQQLGKCSFEWWNEAALLYFTISVKILTDICVAPFLSHGAHRYNKLWVRRDIFKLPFIIITSKTLTANIYWALAEPDLVFSATHALPN